LFRLTQLDKTFNYIYNLKKRNCVDKGSKNSNNKILIVLI